MRGMLRERLMKLTRLPRELTSTIANEAPSCRGGRQIIARRGPAATRARFETDPQRNLSQSVMDEPDRLPGRLIHPERYWQLKDFSNPPPPGVAVPPAATKVSTVPGDTVEAETAVQFEPAAELVEQLITTEPKVHVEVLGVTVLTDHVVVAPV